jgi:3-oxoacyl-[acyl-carrier-protein] synthase II
MSTNSNKPRVAVTGYMAHFGGPKRRAWRWRLHSHAPQITLSALTSATRDNYGTARSHPKTTFRLMYSLNRAMEQWHASFFSRGQLNPKLCLGAEHGQVIFSSSKGDVFWLEEDYRRWQAGRERKWDVPRLGWTSDYPARWLAPLFNAQSPVAACATGAHCIARGAQMIGWGQADWALCGAVEASLTPLVMAGYRQLGALSKSKVMRPFDKRRDGFVPSEGIGALVLESDEHARARGAKIHAYVTGYDMGADATSLTGMCPSGASIARAMERALKRAGNPQIDYINAHGTATPLNDAIESRAIKSVFGTGVPVSSTKPLTGHLLGAAGAVEAVICLQALREQWAPPTLNLEEPDDECDLDYIPVTPTSCGRALPLKTVMSLNYGFGGHIGVLIFEAAQ